MIVNEIKNLSKPFKLRETIGEEENMVGEERRGWIEHNEKAMMEHTALYDRC